MGLATLLIGLTRALVGASPRWVDSIPSRAQRIYFANHTSHIDTLALWSALPADLRIRTRPVAAADYWNQGFIRRHVAVRALNAVLIERTRGPEDVDPLQPLIEALEQGDSLIFFPEGARHRQALPAPFKAGLYHLALRFPEVELAPVYLENLHRCMPKGTWFPVPLMCTVRFGPVLPRIAGESKAAFLERARQAVVALA